MAGDIQKLAEELANLNKNSTLWAQPQMQPQLQSYANATPGALSPSMLGGSQVNMNYALQQQHLLNPFRAQAYGGNFNSMMPGAEYATSSRMGIYRESSIAVDPASRGQHSFWDDLATSYHFKSYAAYEDPFLSRLQTSQRMSERKENLATGAIGLGGAAASFMPWAHILGGGTALAGAAGVAAGVASVGVGLVAAPVAAGMVEGYYDRRNETARIQNVMRDLVTGVGVSGAYGQGVSADKASNMMLSMRTKSAHDPHKSMDDYMNIFETGAASGLFNFEGTDTAIVDKVKKATKMIDTIMLLAGDSTIQSAVQRMSKFQAMGVDFNSMESTMTSIKASALLAGTTFEDIMNQGGSIGAQQAQLMGASSALGMHVGSAAYATANTMIQGGTITTAEAAARGGKKGMAQRTSSMQLNDIHSYLGTRIGAIMDSDGNIDQSAFDDLISGKTPDAINKSITNARKMGLRTFVAHNEDALVNAEAELTKNPYNTIRLLRTIYQDMSEYGHGGDMQEYFKSRGSAGKELAKSVSLDAVHEIYLSNRRVEQSKKAQDKEKRISAGRFWNERATAFNVFADDMMSGFGYNARAREQEIEASIEAGAVYRENPSDPFAGYDISNVDTSKWGSKVKANEALKVFKHITSPSLNAMLEKYGDQKTQEFAENFMAARIKTSTMSKHNLVGRDDRERILGLIGDPQGFGSGIRNLMNDTFQAGYSNFNPEAYNTLSDEDRAKYHLLIKQGAVDRSHVTALADLGVSIDNQVEQGKKGETYRKLKGELLDLTDVIDSGYNLKYYDRSKAWASDKTGLLSKGLSAVNIEAGDVSTYDAMTKARYNFFESDEKVDYITGDTSFNDIRKANRYLLSQGMTQYEIDARVKSGNTDRGGFEYGPSQAPEYEPSQAPGSLSIEKVKALSTVGALTTQGRASLSAVGYFAKDYEKAKIDKAALKDPMKLMSHLLDPSVTMFTTKEQLAKTADSNEALAKAKKDMGVSDEDYKTSLKHYIEKTQADQEKAKAEILKKGSVAEKNLVQVTDIKMAVQAIASTVNEGAIQINGIE